MRNIENFYSLIGKLVVNFQELDFTLNVLLALLLKEDINVTMAFIVSLPFAKKLDVIKSIAPFKLTAPALLTALDDLIVKLSKAEQVRNRIVHASWIGGGDTKVFFHKPQTSRKHGMKNGGIRESEPSEIESAIRTVNDAKRSAIGFGRELESRRIIRTRTFTGNKQVAELPHGN